MAQYKVPQNVESEDKILGPLTIKQFIYVVIALMWGFLCWKIFSGALLIAILLIIPISGPLLALGLVQREGQSFETYFLAMIRYLLVPRRRSWLKDDTKVVVKADEVKVVKQVVQRDPDEVRGELRKLATIVDARGRIPKSAELQAPDANVQGTALSQRVASPNFEVTASEVLEAKVAAPRNDMLDMQNNPQAVHVGELLSTSSTDVRAHAMAVMQQSIGQRPTSNSSLQAQAASQPHTQNDILQRAAQSSGVLSVQQLSEQVKRQQVLQQGQTVQVRQS